MPTLNEGAFMKTLTLTALPFLALVGVVVNTAAAQDARSQRPGTTDKPAASAPVGTSGSATADYRLMAGDKLRIEVYKDTQLSQQLQVRPDGKITLPLVGDIVAAGKTSMQLRDTISTALEEYITSPVVTVIVTETAPQLVYVNGEVNRPGAFPLTGPLSVIQAIALAGGFTDFADKDDVLITRNTASGTQRIRFDYKAALKDSYKGQPPLLQPGDTVIVK
jgi:polysaccharide export outer membrane protein